MKKRARSPSQVGERERRAQCHRCTIVADVVSFYVLAYLSQLHVSCLRSCSKAVLSLCNRGAAECFAQQHVTRISDDGPCMYISGNGTNTIASLRHATLAGGNRDIGMALANIISSSVVPTVVLNCLLSNHFPRFQTGTCWNLRSSRFFWAV